MRKFGFLSALWFMMFSMMFLKIDGGEGAGGDAGDEGGDAGDIGGDIGDFNIDDPAPQDKSNPPEDSNTLTVPKAEWENIQKVASDFEREKEFNDTVSSIKSEIPGFDVNKVVNKLKEINEKDPSKAEKYNSEVGFKLLWREMSEDVAKNDPVNGGSNKGGGNDFSDNRDAAMKGKRGALGKALEMAL